MELVELTYPGLFLSFVISVRASRQPYSCVGAPSDLMSVVLPVSLVLGVSQAPPTPPPGARLLEEGLACGKASPEKETLYSTQQAVLSPTENAIQWVQQRRVLKCNCSSVMYVRNMFP